MIWIITINAIDDKLSASNVKQLNIDKEMAESNDNHIKDFMDRNPEIVKETVLNAIRKLIDATIEVILQCTTVH